MGSINIDGLSKASQRTKNWALQIWEASTGSVTTLSDSYAASILDTTIFSVSVSMCFYPIAKVAWSVSHDTLSVSIPLICMFMGGIAGIRISFIEEAGPDE